MDKFTEYFTEEGEPTNSVSTGGIDAPESKLGDVVKRGKKRLKKLSDRTGTPLKSFKDHLKEGKLYRGYDAQYDILGRQEIVWFSTQVELAKSYAYKSIAYSKDFDENTKLTIGYIDYKPSNPYNAGWDNRVLTADDLLVDMEKQSGKIIPDNLSIKFLEKYEIEQSILTFWNDDGCFPEILDSLGFDSVKVKEKSTITYGILRKHINNKKGTKIDV